MSSKSNFQSGRQISAERGLLRGAGLWRAAVFAAGLALLAGCQTPPAAGVVPTTEAAAVPEAQTLREGDVLKIAFPGAPNLDTEQQIRRDGRISLSLVGEVVAAGMTPAALEKDLVGRYSSQLVSKEVTVTVVSSSFSVYVSGAVLRPGKITSDHQISVLEAIMEAGGFDNTKANTKRVTVIRNEDGKTRNYDLNVQLILDGKMNTPFYLKASDIVLVPEKVSWF